MIRSLFSRTEKIFKALLWLILGRVLDWFPGKTNLPAPPRSLLLLRPDRLGDFILSSPAFFALLREAGPSCRITFLAGERNEALARKIFPFAEVLLWRKGWLSRLKVISRLILGRFDAAIDFHSFPFSTTSAFLSVLSGASRRAGFWQGGLEDAVSRKVFNEGIPSPEENKPEPAKSFSLVKKIFPEASLRFRDLSSRLASPQAALKARLFYSHCGIRKADKVLGIHPTLGKKDNRWNPANYARLITLLKGIKGLKVVLVHGEGESRELELFNSSNQGMPGVFLLPESDIFFILEAAKRFGLFVCGDSGLMHACALVTRVFAVFGPSDPERWGPLDIHRNRIFRKKDHLCDSVRSEEIARAVRKEILKPLKN